MSTLQVNNAISIDDAKSKYALKFIRQIMALPGAKVDRKSFLKSQLSSFCPAEQVAAAIAANPAHAGIPIAKIDRIADSVIRSHVAKAGIGSFMPGLPGIIALPFTLPADVTQTMRSAIILSQKLAYLYGSSDLLNDGEVDDETELRVAMLLGVMMGVNHANNALKLIMRRFAVQVEKRVEKQALTKTIYWPALKQALKWLGIKLTKQTFAKALSKVGPPVVGGVLSAGLTTFTLRPMARKLKNHLRGLEFAQPSVPKQRIIIDA